MPKNLIQRTCALVAALLAVGVVLAPGASARPDAADAIETFDRDVFVIVGSTLRNPDESTDADEPLFNVAGISLGVTWGDWQTPVVRSTMRSHGGGNPATTVSLDFESLIPGGVYSVFYATLGPDTENPLCPNVERSFALTSRDRDQAPDASSFVAGADGSASFSGRVSGDLLEATQVFLSLVYHADGMTYHPLPNRGEWLTQGENCRSSYGHDAMRQLLVLQKW